MSYLFVLLSRNSSMCNYIGNFEMLILGLFINEFILQDTKWILIFVNNYLYSKIIVIVIIIIGIILWINNSINQPPTCIISSCITAPSCMPCSDNDIRGCKALD